MFNKNYAILDIDTVIQQIEKETVMINDQNRWETPEYTKIR